MIDPVVAKNLVEITAVKNDVGAYHMLADIFTKDRSASEISSKLLETGKSSLKRTRQDAVVEDHRRTAAATAHRTPERVLEKMVLLLFTVFFAFKV